MDHDIYKGRSQARWLVKRFGAVTEAAMVTFLVNNMQSEPVWLIG